MKAHKSKQYVRQHVVPQSYLKRFAEPKTNGKGYYIGVRIEKDDAVHSFIDSVANIAYVDNYYDVSVREDPKYWEHYFAETIEPLYGDPLDGIISAITLTMEGHNVLDEKRKMLLSKLICFQAMRVPAFLRNRFVAGRQIGLEMKNEFFSRFGDQLTRKQKKEITDLLENTDYIKDQTLSAMTDEKRLLQYEKMLCERVWVVNYNNTRIPYFTSDNPVVMYNYVTKIVGYEGNGIGRNDTIIYFPLTSKIIIQLFPKEMFAATGFELDTDRIRIDENEYKYVIGVNCLQMINASKQILMEPGFLDFVDELNTCD